MKKHLQKTSALYLLLMSAVSSYSQNIGINQTGATPHASSVLDLNTGNTFTSPNGKGILPPNVALTSITDAVTVTSPATSLLVYNTATAGTGTAAVVPGYYYWNGTQWVANTGNDWKTTGNAATTAGTNFIGTTDAVDFVTKTNNTERMRVTSTGNVGIGTAAPTSSLHIVATATNTGFQLQDGTQGAGKLLVGDANGKASWAVTTGTTTIINSNAGNVTAVGSSFVYTGANASITVAGYYLITFRLLTDKSPLGCGHYIAFNLGTSSASPTGLVIPVQDASSSGGTGSYDMGYTTTIAYFNPGVYYMWLRSGGGCASNTLRGTIGENSFSLTLLK